MIIFRGEGETSDGQLVSLKQPCFIILLQAGLAVFVLRCMFRKQVNLPGAYGGVYYLPSPRLEAVIVGPKKLHGKIRI